MINTIYLKLNLSSPYAEIKIWQQFSKKAGSAELGNLFFPTLANTDHYGSQVAVLPIHASLLILNDLVYD